MAKDIVVILLWIVGILVLIGGTLLGMAFLFAVFWRSGGAITSAPLIDRLAVFATFVLTYVLGGTCIWGARRIDKSQ